VIHTTDINNDTVINFLQDNPSLLDQYIQNYVSEETVESWLVNKRKSRNNRIRNGDIIYSKLNKHNIGCSPCTTTLWNWCIPMQ